MALKTNNNDLQRQRSQQNSLQNLPPELLIHIYTLLQTAQNVARLSQTCKSLHKFTIEEGWRSFLRTSFPSIRIPHGLEDQSNVTHSLTGLSRAWDRKAFVARYANPNEFVIDGTTGKRVVWQQKPSGQTMGYQPCIDSHEQWIGSRWCDKKEILAWSAGAQLMLRVKGIAQKSESTGQRSPPQNEPTFDEFGHTVSWYTWKRPGGLEGRDDITAINLIKRENPGAEGEEDIVVGTANGSLDLLRAKPGKGRINSYTSFHTNNRPVRSSDVCENFLVACLSDSTIATYSLFDESPDPLHEIDAIPDRGRDCRCWSVRFLSRSRVGIGLGLSKRPIHVYDFSPTGLSKYPLRKFGLEEYQSLVERNRIDDLDQYEISSSVYPVIPLPETSAATNRPGEVFLSGCFDGMIRLHDMRSPAAYVGAYEDPNDDSSIYCLQTLGRERLVAGTSRYSMLKFFDLRVSGGRVYHYTDAAFQSARSSSTLPPPNDRNEGFNGWNLFINPRNRTALTRNSTSHRHRRNLDSPIYSLSSPSSSSSSLYAGVENNVVQFDFLSILDHHPDPTYSTAIKRIPKSGRIDIKGTWNPRGNVLNLGLYEQQGEGAIRLRVQRGVGKYEGSLKGLDERWVDSNEA